MKIDLFAMTPGGNWRNDQHITQCNCLSISRVNREQTHGHNYIHSTFTRYHIDPVPRICDPEIQLRHYRLCNQRIRATLVQKHNIHVVRATDSYPHKRQINHSFMGAKQTRAHTIHTTGAGITNASVTRCDVIMLCLCGRSGGCDSVTMRLVDMNEFLIPFATIWHRACKLKVAIIHPMIWTQTQIKSYCSSRSQTSLGTRWLR